MWGPLGSVRGQGLYRLINARFIYNAKVITEGNRLLHVTTVTLYGMVGGCLPQRKVYHWVGVCCGIDYYKIHYSFAQMPVFLIEFMLRLT